MDIEKLSEKELSELLQKAEERLSKVRARPPKATMLKVIEGIATENGYTLAELFPSATPSARAGPKKLGPAKIKYAHPTDPELSWSGRGSKPRWVVDLLTSGYRLEDISVRTRVGQGNR